MYISKLKIQGFKSFLNKTELNFGEGITTVVGPNGCGKTNIVDAIRWILGEQKTSILRSSKMEDVIFNGSKNHKSVGMCEASLTIHNNLGMLPIEYTDVEITRRLFRSGESEYFLNRNLCRLKDINELFVDTGMSSNAYSVIELKMIDSILSDNADSRRIMFEEAAGINQYKKHRKLTIRKLKSTILDMDRVSDIISEVDAKLRNLHLQLKRYDRYQKMTNDLKSSQILLASAEIINLKIKRDPLEKKMQSGRGHQEAISGQLSLEESLIEQTESKYSELKENLRNYVAKISSIDNSLSRINQDILVWTEQKKASENNIQHFSDELNQSKGRLESTESQISEIKDKISNLEPEISLRDNNFKLTQADFYNIDKKSSNAEKDVKNCKKDIDGVNESLIKSNSSLERIFGIINEKENYLEKLSFQQCDIIVKLKHILKEVFIFFMGGTKKKNNLVLAPYKRYLPNDRGILWYPLDQ